MPKVFISHASEDQGRFVIDLATKLRATGVDAWYSGWEVLPGDSIVQKIFGEGIGHAEVFLIIVSMHSINKRWVQEEINAAFLKRLEDKAKLIPVVLDDCEVPALLRGLVWVRIHDLNDYDAELGEIVRAIYNYQEKPPLGEPPPHTRIAVPAIPELTKADSLVLRTICEHATAMNSLFVSLLPIAARMNHLGMQPAMLAQSLHVLAHFGLLEESVMDEQGDIICCSISSKGFEVYAQANLPRYGQVQRAVGLEIVNRHRVSGEDIAQSLHQGQLLVSHILRIFVNNGFVEAFEDEMGGWHVITFSPLLQRALGS